MEGALHGVGPAFIRGAQTTSLPGLGSGLFGNRINPHPWRAGEM